MYSLQFTFLEGRVVCYSENMLPKARQPWERNTTYLSSKKKSAKGLSVYSKKNIEKKITAFFAMLETWNLTHTKQNYKDVRKPIFTTLTLSQKSSMSAIEIKRKMLQRFLEVVKEKYKVKETFWKAELQKNQNIHFHLILDHFIDKIKIQQEWNKIQMRNGTISKYLKEHGNINAPSTHVEGIDNINEAVRYVLKYVSKDIEGPELRGNLYRFSKGFEKLKPFTHDNTINHISEFEDWLASESKNIIKSDYFTIFETKKILGLDSLPAFLVNEFKDYYNELYKAIYLPEKKPISDLHVNQANHEARCQPASQPVQLVLAPLAASYLTRATSNRP